LIIFEVKQQNNYVLSELGIWNNHTLVFYGLNDSTACLIIIIFSKDVSNGNVYY